MKKQRKTYTHEEKEKVLSLLKAGKSIDELSIQLEIPLGTLNGWKHKHLRGEISNNERDELRKLRKDFQKLKEGYDALIEENKVLIEENDVLKKASIIFAKDKKDSK